MPRATNAAATSFARDLRVALHHRRDSALRVAAADRSVRQGDEKVSHLRVAVEALARRGDHDDAPRGICEDYVYYLVDLLGVGERRTTEFANLHFSP